MAKDVESIAEEFIRKHGKAPSSDVKYRTWMHKLQAFSGNDEAVKRRVIDRTVDHAPSPAEERQLDREEAQERKSERSEARRRVPTLKEPEVAKEPVKKNTRGVLSKKAKGKSVPTSKVNKKEVRKTLDNIRAKADANEAKKVKKVTVPLPEKSKGPGTLQEFKNKWGYTPEKKSVQERARRAGLDANKKIIEDTRAAEAKKPAPSKGLEKVTKVEPRNVMQMAKEASKTKPVTSTELKNTFDKSQAAKSTSYKMSPAEYAEAQAKAAAPSKIIPSTGQRVAQGVTKAGSQSLAAIKALAPLMRLLAGPAGIAAGIGGVLMEDDPTGGSTPDRQQRHKAAGMDFYAGPRGISQEARDNMKAADDEEFGRGGSPSRRGRPNKGKVTPTTYRGDFDEGSSGQYGNDTEQPNSGRGILNPRVPSDKSPSKDSSGGRQGHTINISIGSDGQVKVGGGEASKPQQGGNYPVYKRDSAEAGDFRKNFAESRKKGLPDFLWNGRKYNTKLRGE